MKDTLRGRVVFNERYTAYIAMDAFTVSRYGNGTEPVILCVDKYGHTRLISPERLRIPLTDDEKALIDAIHDKYIGGPERNDNVDI